MRITKTIREYIEESVKTAIIETTPMPANDERERLQALVSNFVSDLTETMQEYAKKHIALFCAEQNIPADFKLTVLDYGYINYKTYNSEVECAARKERQERDKRIEKAVKDIILDLELGGTRADLENKLKALR